MVSEEIVRLTHYCFSFKFYFPNTFLIRISFQIGPHWTILLDIKILSFQEKELYQTQNLKKKHLFLRKLSNIVLDAQSFCKIVNFASMTAMVLLLSNGGNIE